MFSEAFTFSAVTISSSSKYLSTGTTSSTPITTPGLYQLFVDATNVGNGDEFEVGFTEKILSGGSARRVVIARFVGAQAEVLWISPAFHVRNGGDFDIKKIAGTDRAFDASLRAVT